jgi:transposase
MQRGESPTLIARILGVCRTSFYRWLAMAQQVPVALAAKPHPGPKPRLSNEQIRELEGLLLQGASVSAHNFCNEFGACLSNHCRIFWFVQVHSMGWA